MGKMYKCECNKCNYKYEMYAGDGFNGWFIPYYCKKCASVLVHFIDFTKGKIPEIKFPNKCDKCSSNEIVELTVGTNHTCPVCNSAEVKQEYSGEFD